LSLQTTLEKDKNIRSGVDRRNRSGFNLKMLTGDGNRKAIRRQEDQGRIFIVDQYSPVLFMVVVGILFLCVIDAILTLILLNHGAYETNPVMAYLLNISPYAFIIPKYSTTVIGTFGLFICRTVVIRKLNVRTHSLLSIIVCVYLAVVAWELYLIYFVI